MKKLSIQCEIVNIKDNPPTTHELEKMLKAHGQIRKLFNTSGKQYRELDMKSKLLEMTDQQAIQLLSKNGMLIKRPFLIGAKTALLGFKEELWLSEIR